MKQTDLQAGCQVKSPVLRMFQIQISDEPAWRTPVSHTRKCPFFEARGLQFR